MMITDYRDLGITRIIIVCVIPESVKISDHTLFPGYSDYVQGFFDCYHF